MSQNGVTEDHPNVTAEVAKHLSGIKERVGKIAISIVAITAASKEQSQGIAPVNTAVSERDQVVRQNTAHAEASDRASESLSVQAQQLNAGLGRNSRTACPTGVKHVGEKRGFFHPCHPRHKAEEAWAITRMAGNTPPNQKPAKDSPIRSHFKSLTK